MYVQEMKKKIDKGEYIKNLQVIENGSKRVRVPTVTKRLTEGYSNDCSVHSPQKKKEKERKREIYKKLYWSISASKTLLN